MTSPFSDIERTHEFERDLKKLLRRYRTLEEDINTLINASLYAFHKLDIDTGGIHRLQGLGFEHPSVYKVKKFACRSMKGKGSKTGLRLIYSYSNEADRVVLIELYYKGDKDNEDRARINRLYKGNSNSSDSRFCARGGSNSSPYTLNKKTGIRS